MQEWRTNKNVLEEVSVLVHVQNVCLCSFFLSSLPVNGASGCGSWLSRKASPGCSENRWPLVPRSIKGRSNVKAQRAQPQGSEVEKQGLSERAAGWSGPLGIVCMCLFVLVCMCGRGKGGGCILELGLCLTWYALALQIKRQTKEKRKFKINWFNMLQPLATKSIPQTNFVISREFGVAVCISVWPDP